MERPSFTFRKEWRDAVSGLPDEVRLDIYEAIIEYGISGKESNLKPMAMLAFKFVKESIDKDAERYAALCERNRANGSKSKGRPRIEKPKETQENPTKPKKPTGLSGFSEEDFPPAPPIEEYIIDSNESLSTNVDSEYNAHTCEEVVKFYNKAVEGTLLAKCRSLTDKRRKAIRARLHEYGFDKVCEAIEAAAHSDFCNGRNDRNWTADFDFVMNANKMARLLENKYNTVYGTGNIQSGGQRPTAQDIIRDIQIRHILSSPQPDVTGAEGRGEGVQRGFPFD